MNENDDVYFKDCFTEQDGKINVEFNKATIKCLNSVNNNFSLDCDGNLSVNSITTRQQSSNVGNNFSPLDFYPIGIYIEISDPNFNPNTAWGGTWSLENDGTVLVSKSSDTNSKFNRNLGTTLGEENHLLIIDEMPSHDHNVKFDQVWNFGGTTSIATTSGGPYGGTNYIENRGGSQSHNNVQPSKIVNRWHRIG